MIFFIFLLRMEERMRDLVGMLLKTRLEAAYLSKTYAIKLAH
jgi:hypothetical protein